MAETDGHLRPGAPLSADGLLRPAGADQDTGDTLYDSGTLLFAVAFAGVETLHDAATLTSVVSLAGAETHAEQGAVACVATLAGIETIIAPESEPTRVPYPSTGTIDRFPRVRLDEVAARKSGVVGGQVEIEPLRVEGVVGGQVVITASAQGEVGGRVFAQSFADGVTGGQREISLVAGGVREPAEMYAQALREDEELLLILI